MPILFGQNSLIDCYQWKTLNSSLVAINYIIIVKIIIIPMYLPASFLILCNVICRTNSVCNMCSEVHVFIKPNDNLPQPTTAESID